MFKNLRPGAPQYCETNRMAARTAERVHPTTVVPNSQDLNSPAVGGDTWTRGETLNLTWQAAQKHKVTFYGHFNQRLVDCNKLLGDAVSGSRHLLRAPSRSMFQSTWSNPADEQAALRGRLTFYNER